MNKGERDELLAVIRLVQMRDSRQSLPLIGEITSVGFNGREYKSSPWDYDSGKPSLDITESDLIAAARSMGLYKAGRYDKADVNVNGIGISLKSMRGASPAIVNHTGRHGWARICEQIKHDISPLDDIIFDYWKHRENGTIKEDIANSNSNSPFRNHKEYIKPLLAYFLFSGTGSRDSMSPAEYLLDFTDPVKESTWRVFSPDGIVDFLWPNLVFSIRYKRGVSNYQNILDPAKKQCATSWTKRHQDKHRGLLHVRVYHEKIS